MTKGRIYYLKLKYLRERMNNTQTDFASLVGLSKGQYSRKENGDQPWFLSECIIIQSHINNFLECLGEERMILDEIYEQTVCNSNKGKRRH